MESDGLTEKQRKWAASVRTTLETSTGRSLAHWVEIARSCPHTAPRARVRWFKDQHGLGQNYALTALAELEKESGGDFARDPAALRDALWCDPAALAILKVIEGAVAELPGVVTGQRKAFTSWSRAYAFAAARPVKGGTVRLGLALAPETDARLLPGGRESWSERLKSAVALAAPDEVDAGLRALLAAAFARS